MNKQFSFLVVCSFLLTVSYVNAGQKKISSNKIIVKLKKEMPQTLSVTEIFPSSLQIQHIDSSELLPELKFLTIQEGGVEKAIQELNKHPLVEYAEPNFILKIDIPSRVVPVEDGDVTVDPQPLDPPDVSLPAEDPELEKAWGIKTVKAQKAWEITTGSKDIIVAVIDTGIDYNHEDLIHNVYRNTAEIPNNNIDDDKNGFVDDFMGWDFVNDDHLPFDDSFHGTHVAGTIGAVGQNGVGVSGVAQQVRLMSIKVFNAAGYGETMTAVKAVEYAINNGAKVINNSWGDTERSQALEDIIEEARRLNIVVVCAAGNSSKDNDKEPMFPASIKKDNVISVGATVKSDKLAWFSNFGKNSVHVSAPGHNIYSTIPVAGYFYLSGTSMASPHVAGAAAMVLSVNPELTPIEVRELLMKSGDSIKHLEEKTISGKRLNVLNAVNTLLH